MTKVLIVDQDQDFAAELRAELVRLGCNVRVAADGPSGLTIAAADHPDLIVVSAEVPRINGFSVCNKIKKSPTLREVPVILLSSRSAPAAFEHHQRLPTRADDYVRKPITVAALLPRVMALLAPMGSSPGEVIPDDEIFEEVELDTIDGSNLAQVAGAEPPSGSGPHSAPELPNLFEDEDQEEQTVVANRGMLEEAARALPPSRTTGTTRSSFPAGPSAFPSSPVTSSAPPSMPARSDALAQVNQHLAEARRQLALAERRAKVAEQKASQAEQRVEQIEAEKSLAEKRAADFKAGAKKIADQLNQRAAELRELQVEHEKAIAALEDAHRSGLREADERHRRSLESAVGGRDADRAALVLRIGELEEDLAQVQGERATVEEQHERRLEELRAEQEKQLEDLQRENAEALQQVGYELQEKLMQKEESFKALKEQLDKDLQEMGEEARHLRERLADQEAMTVRLAELEQQLATMGEEREDAAARSEALSADSEELRQELARERSRAEAMAEEIASQRALLQGLRDQLVEIVTKIPVAEE